MGAELIPMAFTTGWGSGINAYAVVLVLGLADKIFNLSQIPNALARTDVLIGAGATGRAVGAAAASDEVCRVVPGSGAGPIRGRTGPLCPSVRGPNPQPHSAGDHDGTT